MSSVKRKLWHPAGARVLGLEAPSFPTNSVVGEEVLAMAEEVEQGVMVLAGLAARVALVVPDEGATSMCMILGILQTMVGSQRQKIFSEVWKSMEKVSL